MVACIILCSVGTATAKQGEGETLYQAILAGRAENRAKLKCVALQWRRSITYVEPIIFTREEAGLVKGKTLTDRHQQWMDGVRMAVWSEVECVRNKPDGTYCLGVERRKEAYDGNEYHWTTLEGNPKSVVLRSKPQIGPNSWLNGCGWEAEVGLKHGVSSPDRIEDFSGIEESGERLIAATCRDANNPSVVYSVNYLAPSRGFQLVRTDDFATDSQPRLKSRTWCRVQEVAPGLWFPVESKYEIYNAKCVVVMSAAMSIDLKKSSFNKPSALPEGVFTLPIRPGMRIVDRRGPQVIQWTARQEDTGPATRR